MPTTQRSRHTILIDIAKKAEENTKNAKIKMTIE